MGATAKRAPVNKRKVKRWHLIGSGTLKIMILKAV